MNESATDAAAEASGAREGRSLMTGGGGGDLHSDVARARLDRNVHGSTMPRRPWAMLSYTDSRNVPSKARTDVGNPKCYFIIERKNGWQNTGGQASYKLGLKWITRNR